MNSRQIERYISRNCNFHKLKFFKVLSADEFMKLDLKQLPKPFGIVINSLASDERNQTGHWVCAYSTQLNVFYWDSLYNNYVTPYSSFIRQLRLIDLPLIFNKEIVQSQDSDLCGVYTIVFFYYMLNGCGYDAFLSLFKSNDSKFNDKYVREMFHRMIECIS